MRVYYAKSRKQIFVERVLFLLVVFFIAGVLVGMCLSGALHKCEVNAVEIPTEETTPMEETPVAVEETLNYLGNFRATAYCPCYECSEGWGNNTSTGAVATQGRTIAVDSSVIPYGTKVVIDGHEYIAEDTGGAIKGKKVDIYFDNHEEATNFGVQYKDVYAY
jgi:3D (Asp-Asp-Asp) domain-containing protein